jgi:release factor glutamine methyltransferase
MTFEVAEHSLKTALEAIYDNREAAAIAAMVMEFVTGKSIMDRWLIKNELLADHLVDRLQNYSNELVTGKPVQYVIGEAWFAGLCLEVTPDTLIPRPETEELVNWCASWAATHLKEKATISIIEVGTGTGCISIALQKKLPFAKITALDISDAAIKVATNNAATYKAPITFKTLDFLDETCWLELGTYDIIISNPPYIAEIEKENMAKHVIDFEPHTALFVESNNPLIFYKSLANFGNNHLNNDGALFVEINQALGMQTQDVFVQNNYTTMLKKDFFENDRMILATKTN